MARARAASRRKGNSISVNFEGVETRGRFHEEGDYLLEIVAASQEDGEKFPYISWELKCVEGDNEGAIVYNNTSLGPKSLWNLKSFLEAAGTEVPDSELDIDLDELIGQQLMGKIEMETYEGKPRPRLVDFWAAEAEDEKPAKKKRGGKASAKDDDDEDEKPARGKKKPAKKAKASVTEDEINDMDEDELKDLIDEHDLDVDLDDFKTLRKMRGAVIDAAGEADILADGEEPDEDEDEKPARRRGKKPAAEDDDEEEEKPKRKPRRR